MIEEPITNKTENRLRSVVQKSPREATGMNGALFAHVDFDRRGRPITVSFSWRKAEENNTLDAVLVALGDAVTQILRDGPV